MSRAVYEDYVAGQWWFDAEDQADWGPALATVADYHGDDDGEPITEDDDGRPRCAVCGGPNYSLASERCIACRLGI
jgi:hypothetical protein